MLGVKRKAVRLENNHEEWRNEFLKEKENLNRILGTDIVDVQHVGSTAINEILAKPIIDIAIGVKKKNFKKIVDLLIENGYIYRPDNGDKNRCFVVKGDESCRTHYLHIHVWGSKSWYSQIYFRDVLNNNTMLARKYEKLKIVLLEKYKDDRDRYTLEKDAFIKNVIKDLPLSYEECIVCSEENNIPVEDVIFISLNRDGINAKINSPRIRTVIYLNSKKNEKFYFGLPNNKYSCFRLISDKIYLYEKFVGKTDKLENDDCASSYFRKAGSIITLNSNSRSECRGCKFCPNNLELNSEDKNLNTFEKLEKHFNQILNGKSLGHIERLTVCTGCFGSEERALEHLLLVYSVAKHLYFRGVFHYIGSEIRTIKTMNSIKESVDKFMYTFTVECFTKRSVILKNTKAEISLDDYYSYMKNANSMGFIVNYIYVLGLDPLNTMFKYFVYFSKVCNNFPLINIFQPHVKEHWELLDEATSTIDYYIKTRKYLEELYKSTSFRTNSWECYRPLWYFSFGNEEIKCTRI